MSVQSPKVFPTAKKSDHFKYVLSNGIVYKLSFCSIFVVKKWLKDPAVAYVAGKKLGKAVVRNKAKRRLRELFYNHCKGLDNDYDYIFMAKSQLLTMQWQDILAESYQKLKNEKMFFFE